MPLHVQKYGGTSVATTARIEQIAERIVRTRQAGTQVVVVVSAMGGTTDNLLALAHEVSAHPTARELDMLLTAGERITMALLSMALHERGVSAISFTGSQSGILTDTWHGSARIREIRATRLREALDHERVVIVAGFQGVSDEREVTTLGRGGSDTSAVALAVTLQADQCDICTDVAGVFTADPRRVDEAQLLPEISYEEMLSLAENGARVLHPRAAELASRYAVPLRICSSFEEGSGTIVKSSDGLEPARIQGVTSDENLAALHLQMGTRPERLCADLLEALAAGGLSPRELFEGRGDEPLTVLLEEKDMPRAVDLLAARFPGATVQTDTEIARVALVGHALQTPGVAARVLAVLAEADIQLQQVHTTPMSLTGLVRSKQLQPALEVLHAQIGPRQTAAD